MCFLPPCRMYVHLATAPAYACIASDAIARGDLTAETGRLLTHSNGVLSRETGLIDLWNRQRRRSQRRTDVPVAELTAKGPTCGSNRDSVYHILLFFGNNLFVNYHTVKHFLQLLWYKNAINWLPIRDDEHRTNCIRKWPWKRNSW